MKHKYVKQGVRAESKEERMPQQDANKEVETEEWWKEKGEDDGGEEDKGARDWGEKI